MTIQKNIFVRTIQEMKNKGQYKGKIYNKKFLYIPQDLTKRFDIQPGQTVKITVIDNESLKLEIERI
jgi:uncharacterized membrane protein (UPF0127 family)